MRSTREQQAEGEAADVLQRSGLRPTRQRVAVVRAMRDRPDAVTAQELHHELRRRAGAPGLATIYRTLSVLARAGELDTLPRDGEQAFRLCGSLHHHHLVCESCGAVEEVESDLVESWVKQVARRSGFRVTGHTADVYGVCGRCA